MSYARTYGGTAPHGHGASTYMSKNEILLHTQQCLCFFSDTALCHNNARKQYMDQNPNVQNQKPLFLWLLGFKPLRLYYFYSIAALIVFFFFRKISKFSVIFAISLPFINEDQKTVAPSSSSSFSFTARCFIFNSSGESTSTTAIYHWLWSTATGASSASQSQQCQRLGLPKP